MTTNDQLGDVWADEYGVLRREVPHGDADLLAELRNGTWLDAQTFPPLRWAVNGVIPEGMTLLAGAPKVGKSWLTLSLAIVAALGTYALGQIKVQRRPVLLLALEDGDRRLQERARQILGDGVPLPQQLDYLTCIDPRLLTATVSEWLQIHGHHNPVLILDTLGKVKPPASSGESAYQHDYRVGSGLKSITDDHPGSSLIVVHHIRKLASDDFVDSVSGTNGLAGAADSIITLTRPRHEDEATLSVTGRDVEEAAYRLTRKGRPCWELDGATLAEAAQAEATAKASDGLGDRSADIVSIVGASGTEGIGPTAVAAKLNIEPKHAGEYLARLARAGRVIKASRGRYTPVSTVSTHSTAVSAVSGGLPLRTPEHGVETVESVEMPGQTALVPRNYPLCTTCGEREVYRSGTTVCGACDPTGNAKSA